MFGGIVENVLIYKFLKIIYFKNIVSHILKLGYPPLSSVFFLKIKKMYLLCKILNI